MHHAPWLECCRHGVSKGLKLIVQNRIEVAAGHGCKWCKPYQTSLMEEPMIGAKEEIILYLSGKHLSWLFGFCSSLHWCGTPIPPKEVPQSKFLNTWSNKLPLVSDATNHGLYDIIDKSCWSVWECQLFSCPHSVACWGSAHGEYWRTTQGLANHECAPMNTWIKSVNLFR